MLTKSGLRPLRGELLNGFIFRVLIRIGYDDFTTLVTKGGGGMTPSVPYLTARSFSEFNTDDLIELFEENIPYKSGNDIFISNFLHLLCSKVENSEQPSLLFRDVFFPAKKRRYAGKRFDIRFCSDCINNQIKNHGFAYFKHEWRNLSTCQIHSKPLLAVDKSLSSTAVVKALKGIMRGKVPKDVYELPYSKQKITIDMSNSLKIAPCLKDSLLKYFLTSRKYYPTGYTELADYGFLTDQERKLFTQWQFRKELNARFEEVYQMAMEQNYREVIDFINKTSVLVCIKYFDGFLSSNDKWLMKLNDKDCFKCTVNNAMSLENCGGSKMLLSKKVAENNHHIYETENGIELLRHLSRTFGVSKCERFFDVLCFRLHKYQEFCGVDAGERRLQKEAMLMEIYNNKASILPHKTTVPNVRTLLKDKR
ncbi:hypothetical protein HRJ45_16985 [Vibrio coralliilyticus]|uniref:hypothetical protein n=1 Tax=Vibrio coralliilyticus TaxID=190893 RepID=UPI0015604625|nr:hypothetical protein [Vibrio coralliilyticus]NRF27455.1 hypothetical protein [Vibrio coralliilyticus]NRF80810.1 hypothetical protein [Vibrio coralliilyticus]